MISEETQNIITQNSEQCSSMLLQEETQQSPPDYQSLAFATYNAILRIPKLERENEVLRQNLRVAQQDCSNKDKRIIELENMVEQMGRNPEKKEKKRIYYYDYAIFPREIDGETVIDELINMTNIKTGKDSWLLSCSRDWYIVWRVLKYYNFFKGNQSSFCKLINDTVLDEIEDSFRRNKLYCDINNFTSIKEDYPPKYYEPPRWMINYQADTTLRALKRAINILRTLSIDLEFKM